MDGVNRVRLIIALLTLLIVTPSPGVAGRIKPAKDSAKPIPFVTSDAMRQLAEVVRTIDAQASSDTLASSVAVGIIRKAWLDGFRSTFGDSTIILPSPIETLVGAQIARIDSMLATAKPASSSDAAGRSDPGPDEVAAAIQSLAALEPAVSSQRDSKRTVLLVVSSVTCDCERRRCDTMLALRSVIAADRPFPQIAVIDDVKMPAVARILSVTTIPSWVLFNAEGRPASIITGFEEPDDVRVAINGWLGTGQAAPK